MTSKLKCPFCQQELKEMPSGIIVCGNPDCKTDLSGYKELWQALIQSQQQLKMLEPIVASLQGRADINAEEARDSNELVAQWYEKYEQSQKDLQESQQATIENAQTVLEIHKDLGIATKALKNMSLGNVPSLPDDKTLANAMCNYARDTLKQIEHKE